MRYDLLLTDRKAYTYEGYMARQLAANFEKKKIPFRRIYLNDGILQEYMRALQEDPPSWIISFLNFLPFEPPFCDIVQVRQFVWLRSSVEGASSYVGSKYGLLGLPKHCDLPNTVFLPHGVETMPFEERVFDTVSFTPLFEGTKGITHTTHGRLDIFGEHQGSNWLKRLPPTVSLHIGLPYTEHFSVLARAKLLIVDPDDIHWKMAAVAVGCLPLMADEEDLQDQIATFLADSQKRKIYLEHYYPQLHSWERQTEQLLEHLR